MKTLIVVPARYKSKRFPGKPLKKILKKELIIRVLEGCKKLISNKISLIVATDDKKIFSKVKKNNFKAILTSPNCLTGTDRVAEVAKKINADIYINVQGDEPLINYKDIKKIIEAKKKYKDFVICGYSKINYDENVNNKNIPKVVINKKNDLLYISRSPIPSSKKKLKINYFKQVCIYGFNKNELRLFSKVKRKTKLEAYEDIEIIRFLEFGKKVKMVNLNSTSYAVDVPSDIKKIEKFIKKNA